MESTARVSVSTVRPVAVSVVNAPVDAEDAPMAVPSIVPALMSMVLGLVPSSTIAPPLSSVNNRLSATLTASSPCTRSLAVGTAEAVELFLVTIFVAMFIYL